MSKVDAQRAMKAARHARTPAPILPAAGRRAAAHPAPAEGTPPAPAAAAGDPSSAAAPVAGATAPGTSALCGHRSMAGKDCRRPAGHVEKNHRYS